MSSGVRVTWPSRGRQPVIVHGTAEVFEFLTSAPISEWHSGSGTLALHRPNDALVVCKNDAGNFAVTYLDGPTAAPGMMMLGEPNAEGRAQFVVSGERWIIPARFSVVQSQVFRAIEYFVESGGRCADVEWAPGEVLSEA